MSPKKAPNDAREKYKVVATQRPSKGDRKAAVRANVALAAVLEMSDAELQAHVKAVSEADNGTQGLLVLLARAVRILAVDTNLYE